MRSVSASAALAGPQLQMPDWVLDQARGACRFESLGELHASRSQKSGGGRAHADAPTHGVRIRIGRFASHRGSGGR